MTSLGVDEDQKNVFMVVYSGKKFYPFDPQPEMIEIEDIAHSRARDCRYNGHTEEHYSVAQHSVLMSRHLTDQFFPRIDKAPAQLKMKALLHDAAESYTSDLPGPIKSIVGGKLSNLEDEILKVIFQKFNLPVDPVLPKVKIGRMDKQMVKMEKRDVVEDGENNWGLGNIEIPVDLNIEPWSFEKSKGEFLDLFRDLKEEI
jgi:hypothetical protein